MEDGATSGAMTEIALALAMAFFCILVLTLVSMGNPEARTPSELLETAGPAAGPRPMAAQERLVLFFGGRFVDRSGAALDPATVGDGPVVLAVPPTLPLERVLAARAVFAGEAVSITPLDTAWIDRLSEGVSR